MPSHAGEGEGELFASCAFDYTEVEGLDNLACPDGVILEAEKLAAEAEGCKHALFVTQGSTVCMHIALSLAKERGEVGCIGDMHKSFYGGCALIGINPVRFSDASEFVEKAKECGVKSLFYTSPDYFGNVVDDRELLSFCAENGVLTVADSAHGAHFAFSSLLPDAAAGRADVSFCSMHKTMNAYTGAALLNLKGDDLYDKAVYYRQLWHTTSPSYLVMASMDVSRAHFEERGEEIYKRISCARDTFEKEASGEKFSVAHSDDLSRLVIDLGEYSADSVNRQLVAKGIYAEAAIGNKLIFILNEHNYGKLPLLAKSLKECDYAVKETFYGGKDRKKTESQGQVEFVNIEDGEGRVCMNEVGFYPPGTPMIRRGEVFTREDITAIAKNRGYTFGLVNGKLVVLK